MLPCRGATLLLPSYSCLRAAVARFCRCAPCCYSPAPTPAAHSSCGLHPSHLLRYPSCGSLRSAPPGNSSAPRSRGNAYCRRSSSASPLGSSQNSDCSRSSRCTSLLACCAFLIIPFGGGRWCAAFASLRHRMCRYAGGLPAPRDAPQYSTLKVLAPALEPAGKPDTRAAPIPPKGDSRGGLGDAHWRQEGSESFRVLAGVLASTHWRS